jgi:ADP-ribose pyrophosphatase YjhB (NUDIX family)
MKQTEKTEKIYSIDHHIQRKVMQALLTAPTATYSMLKPKDIESNLFLYHVQQLIRAGLVVKEVKTYRLTEAGKQYLDRANLHTMTIRTQPKLVVMLAVQNGNGQYLIQERLHQPFLAKKGFLSTKLRLGETLYEAAYRELTDKSNLTANDVDLALRGNTFLRFFDQESGLVTNHIIVYMFSGVSKVSRPEKLREGHSRSFWSDQAVLTGDSALTGHYELAQLLARDDYFVEGVDIRKAG